MDKFNEGNIFIDEAYTWIESRHSGKALNLLTTYFIFQKRKRFLDIYLTEQLFSSIDKRARELSNIIIECKSRVDFKKDDFEFWYIDRDSNIDFEFIIPYNIAKQYFEYYDTYEIIQIPNKSKYEYDILKNDQAKLLERSKEIAYIINPKLRRIYTNYSGGSTGEPTKFMQDNYYSGWSAATKRLFNEWAGRKPGELLLKLWGSERDVLGQSEETKHKIGNWIRNMKILNSFRMTQENMKKYIKEINYYMPKMILAYVQSIYELAKFAKQNDLKVYSPESIMTSAGILYPEYKNFLQDLFQCPVYNRYGTREVGDIACDYQKHEGLHINVFTHYIEIIDREGNNCEPGKMGEVVVTNLRNYTMPLIRFKLGDMAVLSQEQCSCGRGLLTIEKVIGRVTDVFKTRDGKIVPGEYFIHFIGVVLNKGIIKRFQVIQEKDDYIIVKLVLDSKEAFEKNKKDFDDIKDKIKLVMGKDTKVDFKLVDEILPTKSGKYRYTISKVYQ